MEIVTNKKTWEWTPYGNKKAEIQDGDGLVAIVENEADATRICFEHNTQYDSSGLLPPYDWIFCAHCDRFFYAQKDFLAGKPPINVFCPYCQVCVIGIVRHPNNEPK